MKTLASDLGYLDTTVSLLKKIESEQLGNIQQAAELMA
jgi:hypothetical protein